MRFIIAFGIILVAAPAMAQTTQITPSQIAIQVDNIVNQWAQTIETQQKQIAELQKEVAECKAPKSTPDK